MIKQNIQTILSQLPEHVTLIAVSKTHSTDTILEAYNAGLRDFAENKVQELTAKQPLLPADIRWHMIGHLQRNKVKYLIPFVHLIHSVDSERLLNQIQNEATKANKTISVLLQVHIAQEDHKFGFNSEEIKEFFEQLKNKNYPNVSIKGLMGMSTFTDDESIVKKEFDTLKDLFDLIKLNHGDQLPDFKELSMGMSSDFLLAVKRGSTMVRVGSSIFGERDYS
ncbi:MAG: YggS family pyridoxal phosphate-dependent enzyme [Salinivirgaceae bacterium]|jgi:pyridoxal phosphate enzyme (YggS family)|nr:YggS family pyridoxal phosphate-dependent enzyme [Bacteroidales bacterium]